MVTAATKPVTVFIASDSTAADFSGTDCAGWGQMLPQFFTSSIAIANYADAGESSDAAVQANLERYVTEATAAKVIAILVSPPARATYLNGVITDQSSLHPAAAQDAATTKGAAYIDLTALSTNFYNSIGEAEALKLHANNGVDKTYTNLDGATRIEGLVAKAIETQKRDSGRRTFHRPSRALASVFSRRMVTAPRLRQCCIRAATRL